MLVCCADTCMLELPLPAAAARIFTVIVGNVTGLQQHPVIPNLIRLPQLHCLFDLHVQASECWTAVAICSSAAGSSASSCSTFTRLR